MSSSSSTKRGSGSSRTCQDCGNKFKRDCEHKRCRSCCKTRGFQCPTHVRSTWVPVARRRQLLHQRLSLSAAAAASALPLHLLTAPSSSGFQGRIHTFPAEVNSVANFRCVRVISDDNAVDQAAYQTSVNIGGRVFSGILTDQGPYSPSSGGGGGGGGGSGASGAGGGENSLSEQYLHHHQLVGIPTTASGGVSGSSGGGANPPYLYPHQYPFYASNAPFIMPFFPHPKP